MKSKRKSNNFYNENTTENLWDAPKAFLRGKFIAIQSYLKKKKKKKQEKTLNRQLNFTPKTAGKRIKKKNSRRSEIRKIPGETNVKRNERNNSSKD